MEASIPSVLLRYEDKVSDDAAEEQYECVNPIQSVDQGPHNADFEHTTHVHIGQTADLNENVFSLEQGSTHMHSVSEGVVLGTEDMNVYEGTNYVNSVRLETCGTENESGSLLISALTPKDNNTPSPSASREKEEAEKEKFDPGTLSYELQVGYKILINLMGAGNRFVNKLFLHPVDDNFPETAEYYTKIKNPMWMRKMKEKFENFEYSDLTEFMADFKLMIENCYRYNGPDNFVSKKATKLETMMKQKIALLSKDLREKLVGSVSTEDDVLTSAGIRRRVRNPNASAEDESQVLLTQLRRDKATQEKEDRKQRSEDKKAVEAARIQGIQTWEDEFMGEDIRNSLKTMWEVPQIGMFVYLCMECLGLEEEVTQFQLERGLVAPRECQDFQRLMTCLLSTQHQRKSVKSFMPYSVWNKKLSQKLDVFYKVLFDCGGNHQQACYKLGFDNRAFKIVGKTNPLLKKQFHQLSFLKRVWIVKSYCDHCVEAQTYLQKTIEETEAERPMDVREVLLGSDGRGNRYINFPMFTGKDIRIYRYAKLQEPSLSSLGLEDWSMMEDKPSASSSTCSTPVNVRTGRGSEPASSSLRARAILQAAESKEASPVRSNLDLDENSNSNISSELNDPLSKPKGSGGGYKKRKKSSFFTGKRKRQKAAAGRADAAMDEYVDSPGTEREDDSVKGDDQDDSQGFNVPKFQTDNSNNCPSPLASGDADCDSNNSINGCDVESSKPMLNPRASGRKNNSKQQPVPSSLSSQPLTYANVSANDLDQDETNNVKTKLSRNVDGGVMTGDSGLNNGDAGSEKGGKGDGVDDCNGTTNKNGGNEKKNGGCDNDGDEEAMETCGKNSDDQDDKSNVLKKESAAGNDDVQTVVKEEIEEGSGVKMEECGKADGNSSDVGQKDKEEGGGIEVKKEISEGEEQKLSAEVKTEIKEEEPEEEEESDEEDLPDLGSVELVAESMEEIRTLMNKLSNPEPIKRGKRQYPGVMKPCEEELLENLTRFYNELLKYERSLLNARVHAQVKLRKEVENYCEPKAEETKGWESEASQSSKETSEDEDESKKENAVRTSKRAKAKSLKELLASAANKLMTLNGENDDTNSNDSHELDISSRGRLRKRRVIPNNTEDTCLKKRKNLSQDFPATSDSPPSTPTHSASTSHAISTQTQGQGIATQHLSSLTSSPQSGSNAIKAHLSSSSAHRTTPCQIVRLVSPGGDGTAYRTVRIAGKPNALLSPEKLAGIQFISSTGVFTIPRSQLVASGMQSSHPVIQNLLNNQVKSAPNRGNVTQVVAGKALPQPAATANIKQGGGQLLSKILSSGQPNQVVRMTQMAASSKAQGSHPVGATVVRPTLKTSSSSSSPAAMVVTQVSNSFISQGGKQVLDLGSLSVTQIQQLVKNQAIQINTGAGQPTTLLLTTGLQQLAAAGKSSTAATTTLASAAVGHNAQQVKDQAQVVKNQLGHVTVIPRNTSSQPPVIRTIINCPTSNATGSIRVANPSVINRPISQGTLTVVPGGTLTQQQQISSTSATRIIGGVSAQNQRLLISSQGPNNNTNNANSLSTNSKENPNPNHPPRPISNGKPTTSSSPNDQQQAKPNWVSIPTTYKKYAGNVTVKALLENRTAKKCDNMEDNDENVEGCELSSNYSNNKQQQHSVLPESKTSVLLSSATCNTTMDSTSSQQPLPTQLSNSSAGGMGINSFASLPLSMGDNNNAATASSVLTQEGRESSSSASISVAQSLSLDAALQPLLRSSLQVSLPTVNIKVPSPNTLPSMTHNKHSTTIVQSTKGSIPVASTQDSLLLPTTTQFFPHGGSIAPLFDQSGQSTTVTSTVASLPSQPQMVTLNPQTRLVNHNQQARVTINPSVMSLQNPTIGLNPTSLAMNASGVTVVNSLPGSVNSSAVTGVAAGNPAAPGANLKNVMLKLTPPKGGSGQFVQAYMTPQGKLVIPQAALFPQQQQQQTQVLQAAGPNRVILANTSQAVAALQASQIQAKTQTVINGSNGSSQVKIGQPNSVNVHLVGQQQNNQQQQVVIANAQQASSFPANSSTRAIPVPVQSGNPGIKLMLINPPNVQTMTANGQQQGIVGRNVNMVAAGKGVMMPNPSQQQPTIQTSTPASELVKQIANNTQQLKAVNQQQQQKNFISFSSSSNANNPMTVVSQSLPGSNGTPVVQSQGHQVAAQILALQQQGVGGQHHVQVQQLGHILTQQPRPQGQTVNTFSQPRVPGPLTAAKPVQQQQTQMVQLAINPQTAGGARAMLAAAQPTARMVQVAGQLSPQIQLTNQAGTPVQQQVGLIIQPQQQQQQQQATATILQPGQTLVRPQGTTVVQLHQANTLLQQQQQQQQKSSQLPSASTIQQVKPQMLTNAAGQLVSRPIPGNLVQQPQIQFVINTPASSAGVSAAGISLARLANPVIHPVIRAVTTTSSTALASPSSSAISMLSLPQQQQQQQQQLSSSSSLSTMTVAANSGAVKQQLAANNNLNHQLQGTPGQFLVSPIKLATGPSLQNRLVSPFKLVQPPTAGSLTDQRTSQLVVQNTSQLLNLIQGSQASQVLRPTANSNNNTMTTTFITVPSDNKTTTLVPGIQQQSQQQVIVSGTPVNKNHLPQVLMQQQQQPSLEDRAGGGVRVVVPAGNAGTGSVVMVPKQGWAQAGMTVVNGDNNSNNRMNQEQIMASNNCGATKMTTQLVSGGVNGGTSGKLMVGGSLLTSPALQNGSTADITSVNLQQMGSAVNVNNPSAPGHRRNTFGGSQDAPKIATIQRHASVEEQERDEKEAALNLLTLANQM